MSSFPFEAARIFVPTPLTVEELEDGLHLLDQGGMEVDAFWEANLAAFRQAMLVAISETSGLLSGRLPYRWRRELEVQLKALHGYIDIVDLYVSRRDYPSGARLN